MLTFRQVLPGDADAISIAQGMFKEYQRELGVDLGFQSFHEELRTLPGKYSPPSGALYLAYDDDDLTGCGAIRPLTEDICEIKRVYIRPQFRRKGIARALSTWLLADADEMEYRACRLDTLERLSGALALYYSLGFVEIPAYNFNPEPDIVYLEKILH